jgi:hypothetical protein
VTTTTKSVTTKLYRVPALFKTRVVEGQQRTPETITLLIDGMEVPVPVDKTILVQMPEPVGAGVLVCLSEIGHSHREYVTAYQRHPNPDVVKPFTRIGDGSGGQALSWDELNTLAEESGHDISVFRPAPSRGYGNGFGSCQVCGEPKPLRGDGMVSKHKEAFGPATCKGSERKPKEGIA